MPAGELDGRATDPEGESENAVSSASSSCLSYATEDSRLAACTSGEDSDSVSDLSLGGLSPGTYYSQL